MKIRRKIKKIVGSFLEEQGFSIPTEKGYQSSTAHCIYMREKGEVTQMVSIGKDIFDNNISFVLETSVWRRPKIKWFSFIPEMAQLTAQRQELPDTEETRNQYVEKMHQAANNSKYHIGHPCGWPYKSEEDLERALREIKEIIQEHGLTWLDENCIEEEIIPIDEMGSKLYKFHAELSENFAQKYDLDTINSSSENVKVWMIAIRKRMRELVHLEYTDVQDDLVEIAAFLSEQLLRVVSGEWVLPDRLRGIRIVDMKVFASRNYMPLSNVVSAFKDKETESLEEEFLSLWDSKLPLTSAEIVELVNRTTKMEKAQAKKHPSKW